MAPFLLKHLHIILLIVVLINQILADIPSVKANTVFNLFRDLLKGEVLKEKPDIEKLINEESE